MSEIDDIAGKARHAAAGGWGVLSTGEALASALILNRADILEGMGYTIAQAIARGGPECMGLIPKVERVLAITDAAMDAASEKARNEVAVAGLGEAEQSIHVTVALVTHGTAWGYRSVSLVCDVSPLQSRTVRRLDLHIDAEDSERIARHLMEVHRFAWDRSDDRRPIDAKPSEQRPRWISAEDYPD